MKLKDIIKEEAPPVEQEFWTHVENFFIHPPRDKNDHDHSKEVRFRCDRKTYNFWQKAREAAPEDWFKSAAQFYRSLMSVGFYTMVEYLKTHELMCEGDDVAELMNAFKALAKVEIDIEMTEIKLRARAIKESLAIKENKKVVPILNKIIDMANEREKRDEKGRKKGRGYSSTGSAGNQT